MKKYIVKVHEKGERNDIITYEFDSMEEVREHMKSFRGVLFVNEVYAVKE